MWTLPFLVPAVLWTKAPDFLIVQLEPHADLREVTSDNNTVHNQQAGGLDGTSVKTHFFPTLYLPARLVKKFPLTRLDVNRSIK